MAVPLDLYDYILIARKIIKKYAGGQYCQDEDLEGNLVRAIAYADHTFDPAKKVSLEHWRHIRAIGYMKKYFQRKKSVGTTPATALVGEEYINLGFRARRYVEPPESRLVEQEEHQDRVGFLSELLKESRLTKRQLVCIRKYYVDEQTLQEIAEEFESSIQNVQQCLSQSLDKIRKVL